MNKLSDQWQTPRWLFEQLNEEFNFDIDLAATKENSKCNSFCSDYLKDKAHTFKNDRDDLYSHLLDFFDYNCAFMNPPYSNPKSFIEKAWEDSKHCKIVCLVKCDPTKWWAIFWNYDNIWSYSRCLNCPSSIERDYAFQGRKLVEKVGPKPGCEVRFFPKRIQFDPPQDLIDSEKVWQEKGKWVKKCFICHESTSGKYILNKDISERKYTKCHECKGKGYKELSGPTFPSALVIMDRRKL